MIRYKPLVTIGIPAYNVEAFVENSLKSGLTQNYENIEFLIVPDKCTDKTLEKIYVLIKMYKHLNINIIPPPVSTEGHKRQ